METCKYCGSAIPTGATACPVCGAEVSKDKWATNGCPFVLNYAKTNYRIINLPLDKAFDALLKLIQRKRIFVKYASYSRKIISIKTPVSINSWGFKHNIIFSAIDNDRTRIEILSQPVFGFDIFNYGVKEVEKLVNSL